MILNPEITQKNAKNTENQKLPKYKLSGARFLHLACQGGVRTPVPHINYSTECKAMFAVASFHNSSAQFFKPSWVLFLVSFP